MRNAIFLMLLMCCFAACNSSGSKSTKTYTSDAIGWTIEIPYGYASLGENSLGQNDRQGRNAVENASGQKIEGNRLVHLINFQKDQFNSLNATIQTFDEARDGSYVVANQVAKKAIFDAYHLQKIRVDTSSFQNTFAQQPFQGFLIKVYAPNGEVLMHQLMLSQLRKGYDFAININYNNEKDAALIMDALKNSKFSK